MFSVTGAAGRRFERHVLYLGEISDAQRLSWELRIRVFDEASGETRQIWLLPPDRPDGAEEPDSVQVVLSGFKRCRPQQW